MSKPARSSSRKFSEKIAQLNRKQIKATAEFERTIKEVQVTKEALIGLYRRKSAHQLGSGSSYSFGPAEHQQTSTSYLSPGLYYEQQQRPRVSAYPTPGGSTETGYQANRPVPSIQIFPIEFEPGEPQNGEQQQQQQQQQRPQVSSLTGEQCNLRPLSGGGLSAARSMPNVSALTLGAEQYQAQQYYAGPQFQQPETRALDNQPRSQCRTDFGYQSTTTAPSYESSAPEYQSLGHSFNEYTAEGGGHLARQQQYQQQQQQPGLQTDGWRHQTAAGRAEIIPWPASENRPSAPRWLGTQPSEPGGRLVRTRSSHTISIGWQGQSQTQNRLEAPPQLSRSASYGYGDGLEQGGYSTAGSQTLAVGGAYSRNGPITRRSSYSNFGHSSEFYADLRPQQTSTSALAPTTSTATSASATTITTATPAVVATATATTTTIPTTSNTNPTTISHPPSQHHEQQEQQQEQSSYALRDSYCQCYQCNYYR